MGKMVICTNNVYTTKLTVEGTTWSKIYGKFCGKICRRSQEFHQWKLNVTDLP
jgi:hypothetical protein